MTQSDKHSSLDDDIRIHTTESIDAPMSGAPYNKPIEIIVDAGAWQQMVRHARSDAQHEVGGIMLGSIYEYEGGLAIRITASVEASTISTSASVQFTLEAWRQIDEQCRVRYPSQKLLGWYHTHPNMRAFFSATDHFMHKSYFTQPWHVALVLDPVNDHHKFFGWQNDDLVETPQFLMQVQGGSTPEAAVVPTVVQALDRQLRHLRRDESTSEKSLTTALDLVRQRLTQHLTPSASDDVISLIAACSELNAEAQAAIRRLLAQSRDVTERIRLSDLEGAFVSSNLSRMDKQTAMTIAQGWLAQTVTENELHVHSVDLSRPFCNQVRLPISIRDVTVDEWGGLVLLTHDAAAPLMVLAQNLNLWRREGVASVKANARYMPIVVKGIRLDRQIGKCLFGNKHLYLLTRNEIIVLKTDRERLSFRYDHVESYGADQCGWASFDDLTDWTVDASGNLYLLTGRTKETWRFNLSQKRWDSLPLTDQLERPRSLCATDKIVSVLNMGAQPSITQHHLGDGTLNRRIAIDADLAGLRRIFCDDDDGLFLVIPTGVYQWPRLTSV